MSLIIGAYVSEMFRTSIQSIDNGQREAGIAGGFTKVQTFSEKDGGVELVCVSGGAPVNPLEEGVAKDEFGIKLIKAGSRSVEYRYDNGKNILILRIRGE